MSSIVGFRTAVNIRRRRSEACAILLVASSLCAGQTTDPAPPSSPEAAAIAEWNRLRMLPSAAIDDPLGFLVSEAGSLRRLALMIQDMQSGQPNTTLDPKLQVALLRSLYLAASIDGKEPDYLLRWAAEVSVSSEVPAVRAEAAYRLLIDQLMHVSADSPWNSPLSGKEFRLLDEYLNCYGNTPRAVSAVKRIAEDASFRRDDRDLRECRELVRRTAPQHPVGQSFIGRASAIEAVGKPWSPPLRTAAVGMLNWNLLTPRPKVVLFVDAGQSPSYELLEKLLDAAAAAATPAFDLIVIQIDVSAAPPRSLGTPSDPQSKADVLLSRVDANRLVRLSGGWREPLLTEFDIRSLPTAIVLDDAGLLRQLYRHSDWTMAETVIAVVAAGTTTTREAIDAADTPTTQR